MGEWLQVIPAVSGLVGALIGSGAALFGQHLERHHEMVHRRQSIAFAIAAEIEAYIDIVEHRGWVPLAEILCKQAANGTIPKVEGWLTEQEERKDPFPIFSANMANIGTLGTITGPLAQFYTRVIGIRTTVSSMQNGFYDDIGPEEFTAVARAEIDLWLETVVLGRKLVRDLRAL